MMLERSPPRRADRRADRRRRYVRRQLAGVIVLQVPVSEHALAAALVASGRLSPAEALHRANLQAALAGVVGDFIERWT
jgi:hypothetical protein